MRCFICSGNHHILVHIDNQVRSPTAVTTGSSSAHTNTSAFVGEARGPCVVLLGTCMVRMQDSSGTFHLVRALIDSGAQDCFITMKCTKRLGFQLRGCTTTVAGLGQQSVCQVKGVTQCSIRPCDSNDPLFDINPIVIDSITSKTPTTDIPLAVRDCYKHLVLADRDFDKPSDVDLLLGAELFHHIYDGRVIHPEPGYPAALHSVFGWVLSGPTNVDSPVKSVGTSLITSTNLLEKMMKRFWEVEEPPHQHIPAPEDEKVGRLDYKNVQRTCLSHIKSRFRHEKAVSALDAAFAHIRPKTCSNEHLQRSVSAG
ncbi:unnamed protein product [Parnassius mnemosyne]|uniref:Peptidase aspartic putative domain-containing protein n=1 Tax=Parnassius mnemosyne TaxID=213953 RepID=A0AAV1KQR0_9NEOP